MKHNAFTALSLAAALVVAGSAGATEFSIDFQDYAAAASFAAAARPSATTNAWNAPADDYSFVTNGANKQLVLDTGDNELIYTPTSTDVSILTMDVCFVGADSAPTLEAPFTAKTALYLDTSVEGSPVLKATTDGTTWTNLTASVTEGQWYQVQMKFAGTEVEYFIGGTSVGKATLAAAFTKVTSVGFKGTGMVDNFVGDKAAPAIETDVNGTEVTATAVITANGVEVNFGDQTGIQFIRVYDNTGACVTLRTGSASATIDISKLSGTITRVDAVTTGGTATDIATGAKAPCASEVTVTPAASANDPATITITVPNLVSGLYYTPFDPDNKALAASKVVLPENDGGSTTFSVEASTNGWGVVKFKIVASDEEYAKGATLPPAPASGN